MIVFCHYCNSDNSIITGFTPYIIPAIIAVGSWFVIAYLNRRNEIFKLRLSERFKMRQKMFDLYIDFQLFLNKTIEKNNGSLNLSNFSEGIAKLASARPYFQLYGTIEEQKAMKDFVNVIENKEDIRGDERINAFMEKWKILTETVIKSIRMEYG